MNSPMNDIRGTILVVDDDAAVRGVTSLLLRQHSYRTIECAGAAEAFEDIESSGVDVVLTDIKMPDISGIELLDRIHTRFPDIPVILMTGYADLDTAIEAIKKGAYDFIVKPYQHDYLIYSIDRALKYRRLSGMEQEYRARLEEFNSEMEALISERTMNLMALTLADKIRNPVTVISCLSRILLENREVPPGIRSPLADIGEEAAKLEKMVADFQSLLKSRESLFAYDDLNDVVTGVISLVRGEADHKGVGLDIALPSSPLRMNMQKNLLKIALTHIIRNALDATGKDGLITVRTGQEGDRMVLTVSDTGQGMPDETLQRIFDPFFSGKERSFGLGLPLVKQIVTEHLGEIEVSSAVGKGTVFTLSFPARWKPESMAGTVCPVPGVNA